MAKRKNFFFNVLFTGFILLVIMELLLRLLATFFWPVNFLIYTRQKTLEVDKIQTTGELLGQKPFSKPPGSNHFGFIINSRGFRSPEYQIKKAPGTRRIVFLGDSFLNSSGPLPYPYHFTMILDKKLKETYPDKRFELINLGVSGAGPVLERRLFELEGTRLNPDFVILTFFVGNDFMDDFYVPYKNPAGQLQARSYVCRLLSNSLIILTHLVTRKITFLVSLGTGRSGTYVGSLHDYHPEQPTYDRPEHLTIQERRMNVYHPKGFPWQNWPVIQNNLSRIKDLCDRQNVPFLVVVIPDENQVDRQLLSDILKQWPGNKNDFDMKLPQKVLADFFKKENIRYLDLLPAFRQAGERQKMYFLQDSHWNREGNRLAGEEIFKFLFERGFLKNLPSDSNNSLGQPSKIKD